jgi:putative restriction endonuclease
MPVTFAPLRIGRSYTRKDLADLWGYASYHAIGRGVITPAGTKYIIIFVQHEKRSSDTQYDDELVDGILHWEGEEKHGSDDRIVAARFNGDEIHLFYRKLHVEPFTYHGRLEMTDCSLESAAPSRFVFRLLESIANPFDPKAGADETQDPPGVGGKDA